MIAPGRFTGTVERLGPVDIAAVGRWLTPIPWDVWPQQDRIDASIRPAMVNRRDWCGFGAQTDALAADVLAFAPGGVELARLLSVVMPGHSIPLHTDRQGPTWWARVHVPLTSNPESAFLVGGQTHHLEPGWAYLVNTEVPHAVDNPGATPRVHFMIDIGSG